jgi:hypothetical protein
MRRFREGLSRCALQRDYFAFLKATDGLLHSQGPDRLAIALQSLDAILKEIRNVCGDETEIVLFSDHGMNWKRTSARISSRICGNMVFKYSLI